MNKCTFFSLIFLFLYPIHAFCFELSYSPEHVVQGDVITLKVISDNNVIPEGKIGNRDIFFHKKAAGTFIGLMSTGLEQPPRPYTITVRQGDVEKSINVDVKKLNARTIELTLPKDRVTLSPKNEKRAEYEIAQLRKRWAKNSGRKWMGNFVPPLDTKVSTEFGVVRLINGHKRSIHRGVDFKGKRGDPIRSINGGVVSITDDQFFGGKTVMIDHGDGIYSIYMHLDTILVEEGTKVVNGETIGLVGSTGRATGPHLHMTVKWSGLTINPVSLFKVPVE
ncbi:MAG: M23 family metallopeptidase [Nitrospirota bacterium]|nr:MAG: M23 family metallopeptidase [Nitrospirota bacterium]